MEVSLNTLPDYLRGHCHFDQAEKIENAVTQAVEGLLGKDDVIETLVDASEDLHGEPQILCRMMAEAIKRIG